MSFRKRICSICGEEKSRSNFVKYPSNKETGKYLNYCLTCLKENHYEYYTKIILG